MNNDFILLFYFKIKSATYRNTLISYHKNTNKYEIIKCKVQGFNINYHNKNKRTRVPILLHIASFLHHFCERLPSVLFAPTLCCFSLYAIHAPAIALYALCFTRYPLQYDGRRTTRITFAILLVLRPQYTLYDGRQNITLTP